ncbi:MAG: ABC transporter, partial [Myxococcota bacterium]
HAKLAVRDFIRTLNREHGTTVILTTHDMDDIEALCTRVLVIDKGLISCDGDLPSLRARVGGQRRITVDLAHQGPVEVEGATVVEREGHRVVLDFDPERTPPAALVARLTERYAVRDLLIENPPIEEIVTRLYDDVKGGDG